MSELRPEIRRLIELAKDPAGPGDETAPFGFTARVVARSQLMAKPSPRFLRQTFSVASWTAACVIISCGAVLVHHHRADDPAFAIVAAAQHLAETITP